jgi:hypothetical protein
MGRLARIVVGVAVFVMLFAVVGGGLVPGIANTAQAQGWTFVGAQPVEPTHQAFDRHWGDNSGRITSVAVVPDHPDEVYVGAAGGGVWKSVDRGKSWEPLTDNVLPDEPTGSSMAIGALAVNSTGQTVYAGTGEIVGGDSQYGQGLLKSTDGGETWTVYPNSRDVFGQRYIGGVAFSGNTVLVSTDQGVYKSTSESEPWRKLDDLNSKIPRLTRGQAVSGYVFQLHRDPTTATKLTATLTDGETTVTGMSVALPVGGVYAVTGDGVPADTTLTVTGSGETATLSKAATSTGESSLAVGGQKYWATFGDRCRTEEGGIATSVDGGETWKVVYSHRNAGRIALGVGSDGKVAYAAVANCSGGGALLSILKTEDGEKATPRWKPIPRDTPGYTDYFKVVTGNEGSGEQGNYDNVVAVDPANSNRAAFGGVTILVTKDGGKKFTDVGQTYTGGWLHPDLQAIQFSGPSAFYVGEDGGLYHTSNMGGTGKEATDWTNLNGAPATPGKQGLRITQFNAGVSPTTTELLGGTQDNGAPAALPGVGPMLPRMGDITSGDGGDTAIDPTPNANTVYTSYPELGITRTLGLDATLTATLTTDETTVTGMSRTLPVGTVYRVSGDGIPADTRLIVTGSGTTATLQNAATTTGESTLTLRTRQTPIAPCPSATCTDPRGFYAPFVMDMSNPQRLLAGTDRVYQTFNARTGNSPVSGLPDTTPLTWDRISPKLTKTRGGVLSSIALAPTTLTAMLTTDETTVTDMSVTLPEGAVYSVTGDGIPADTTLTVTRSGTTATLSNAATTTGESTLTVGGATIFTASQDGEVARTTDGGKDWTDITGDLPTPGQATDPFGWTSGKPFFTQVAVNPANSSQAWVTISYLGQGNLWYTSNAGRPAGEGGTTWVNLSGTGDTALPSAPALSLVQVPGTSDVYVGTYYGVWRCGTCGGENPEPSWQRVGGTDLATGALPKVMVDRLSLTSDNKTLVAWTHGRGIWKLSLP